MTQEGEVLQEFWRQVKADPEVAAQEITARLEGRVVYLAGTCATWEQVVHCGHIAGALPGVKGVVNDLKLRG